MEEKKLYRIVNKESGRPQMVGEAFYNDSQLLSQMGFIRQDVDPPKKKEIKNDEPIEEVEEVKDSFEPLADPLNPPQLGTAIPEKGRPGRPKK